MTNNGLTVVDVLEIKVVLAAPRLDIVICLFCLVYWTKNGKVLENIRQGTDKTVFISKNIWVQKTL